MISTTQGAKLTSPCAGCGGQLVRDVGQFVERGRLRWGVEAQCRDCADAWCETGVGPAPQEIREALLTAHGPTRLLLADGEASTVPVMRALREQLPHLSPGEARRMAAELTEAGLVGTLVEMSRLAEGLRNRSVAVTVSPPPS